jgi:elongation factor P
MATTADFSRGLCLEHNGDLWQIVDFQHVKPGKGGAFVRTKMRSLRSGKVVDFTFNAGVKITTARVEHRTCQFLYKDPSGYHFMNTESYEQISLDEEQINAPQFLKEGDSVELLVHAETGEILGCELQHVVELEVTYTEPGLRGDTATNTLKPATLETGAEIRVPLFINIGDKVRIDTHENAYLERVK